MEKTRTAFFALCCATLSAQTIPVTRVTSMADTTISLPSGLNGKPAVLVLGFSRNASSQTKPWADALKHDFGTDNRIAIYQLPMLQQVPRLVRPFVLQGMRKSLSPAERSGFAPVFDNEAAWKAAAHFAAPDDAYVLLVDGLGHIRLQSGGVFDDDKYQPLRKRAFSLELPMIAQ